MITVFIVRRSREDGLNIAGSMKVVDVMTTAESSRKVLMTLHKERRLTVSTKTIV